MRIKLALSFSLLPLALLMSGCGMGTQDQLSTNPEVVAGAPLSGSLHGGRQPIVGASIYMYAADTTAYGHASDSLIVSYAGGSFPSSEDGNGNYYVTTNAYGGFNLAAGEYSCTVGQQVYLYSIGGNTGAGANTAAGLMAVLGTCGAGGTFSAVTSTVNMTEVSTVAAAYAMAGFATDATDVSSSSTSLALTGLTNAFNNAASLYTVSSTNGTAALSTTPNGNGTVPNEEINSIADVLAACINTTGPTSSACSSLFSNAKSGGSSGTTPTDTATAAINIAHNPGNAVSTLFYISPSTGVPWQPTLSSPPNDFTVAITYTDSSFDYPYGIAIDASGNAWVTNYYGANVTEVSPTGVILSGPGVGYTTPDMSGPYGIAIDTSGNAWIADTAPELAEIAPGDTSYNEYTPAGLSGNADMGVAIDPYGNIWVANNSTSAVEVSSSGTQLLTTSGGNMHNAIGVASDTSGNMFFANDVGTGSSPYGSTSKYSNSGTADTTGTHAYGYTLDQKFTDAVAIDASGDFWVTNLTSNSIIELTNTGAVVSGTGIYTGGGMYHPDAIAFDGASYAWISNNSGCVSEFNSSGGAVSYSSGYAGGASGTALGSLTAIAVDGSGDVWVVNQSGGDVVELIGAGTPVVTPIVANLVSPYAAHAVNKP